MLPKINNPPDTIFYKKEYLPEEQENERMKYQIQSFETQFYCPLPNTVVFNHKSVNNAAEPCLESNLFSRREGGEGGRERQRETERDREREQKQHRMDTSIQRKRA